MVDYKPNQTPLMKDVKNLFENIEPMSSGDSYKRLIGKLLYLTNIRPDISYSIHLLIQFV